MVAVTSGQLIIINSVETLGKLLQWRDSHKNLVRSFNNVIEEGVIEYGHEGQYRQEFRAISDDRVRHEYLAGGILKGFGFEYSRQTWVAENITGMITFYPIHLAIQDMITVHASCMALIEHAPQHVVRKDDIIYIKF